MNPRRAVTAKKPGPKPETLWGIDCCCNCQKQGEERYRKALNPQPGTANCQALNPQTLPVTPNPVYQYDRGLNN